MPSNHVHDVIVIGAGPGGSAAAHYLARQGRDVLLLDKSEFPRDKTCGDGLTPRALAELRAMDVLDDLYALGGRIRGVAVHAALGNSLTAPIPRHPAYPDHMLIVPRIKLDDVIRRRALASGAGFAAPVRVRGVEIEDDRAVVVGERGGAPSRAAARLVLIAVGAATNLLLDIGILKRQPPVIRAARGYYEGISGLEGLVEAHFKEVPLPGYGWIFPLSATAANVGLGYWDSAAFWRRPPASPKQAMLQWLERSPTVRERMTHAELQGPIRGYPLRVDFAGAPTWGERILLVGESAGLVSPLTGEGIDFALESGRLAAEYCAGLFERGDFSPAALAGYDALLRRHFQRLFVFLGRIRNLYINPVLMNRTVHATVRFPEIKDLLVKILMSEEDAAGMVNASVIRKVVLGV